MVLAFFIVSNYRQLVKFLTIQPGSLSSQIEIDTAGVHWEEGQELSRQLLSANEAGYSASASRGGDVAAVWSEENIGVSMIFLAAQTNPEDERSIWKDKLQISLNSESNAIHPEISVDDQGMNHIVWTEETSDGSNIIYRSCNRDECGDLVILSGPGGSSCEEIETANQSVIFDWPVISTAGDGSIMAMWSSADNILFYSIWEIGQSPPSSPTGCQAGPNTGGALNQFRPRVSGGPDGIYNAVFSVADPSEETIYQMEYIGQEWSHPQSLGSGNSPSVFSLPDGTTYFSWCDGDEKIRIKDAETELVDMIDFPQCSSRPTMSTCGDW